MEDRLRSLKLVRVMGGLISPFPRSGMRGLSSTSLLSLGRLQKKEFSYRQARAKLSCVLRGTVRFIHSPVKIPEVSGEKDMKPFTISFYNL